MWIARLALVAAGNAPGNLSLYIVGAIAALASVLAAYLAMRGTFRTADVQREAAFDAAVDKDRRDLRAEVEKLRGALDGIIAERDSYRELYAALRVGVRERGLDPDNLSAGGGHGGP